MVASKVLLLALVAVAGFVAITAADEHHALVSRLEGGSETSVLRAFDVLLWQTCRLMRSKCYLRRVTRSCYRRQPSW